MVYASTLLSLLALSSGALASYNGNLNYRSPSLNGDHINMGIDTAAIHRRSLAKRDETPYSASQLNFTHSVASGDPYANSVILWTRIAPSLEASDSNVTVSGDVPLYDHENERYAKASAHPICVEYRVFRDQEGRRVVDSGRAYTSSDIDFTVKVEAKKLRPFTSYWYQFNVCGSDVKSPLGRTKTAPAKRDKVEEVKLAVHSCSNYRMSLLPFCYSCYFDWTWLTDLNSERLLQRLRQRRPQGQRRLRRASRRLHLRVREGCPRRG
jgi:alkaline phosphatase D